jgi:ABC-type phosphate transport system substrate-binding protein
VKVAGLCRTSDREGKETGDTRSRGLNIDSSAERKKVRKTLWGLLVLVSLFTCISGCGGQEGYPISVYTRSDACGAAEMWAKYLGDYHQEDIMGTAVYGDPGVAEAVKQDSLGIGFNNLNYAYDMETGGPIAGLRAIPIDLNENGQIDEDEDFYATKAELMQAIAAGRYPSPPAREEYLVGKTEFTGVAREFVRWILTDGQQYCSEAGYIALPDERIDQESSKLGEAESGIEMAGTITVSGAWALYPMMVKWADEFQKVYPGVNFDISAGGAGKGMTDALSGMVDLGMVSREIYPAEIEQGAFWVSVTKDAVVATVNENNPVLEDLLLNGMRRQTFTDIWITGNVTDWEDAVGLSS